MYRTANPYRQSRAIEESRARPKKAREYDLIGPGCHDRRQLSVTIGVSRTNGGQRASNARCAGERARARKGHTFAMPSRKAYRLTGKCTEGAPLRWSEARPGPAARGLGRPLRAPRAVRGRSRRDTNSA